MESMTYTFYAPCPLLDIEGMQTWLEDMSLEGYLLKGCSPSRHKFEFYRIEPLRTRYRMTPVSDKIEEWNLRPGDEFASITETYGWEHVCSNIRFHIFRAYDEDTREIHTDPAIQAQAVRQLGRRIVKTALVWFSLPLVYMLIILAFGGKDVFWRTFLVDHTGIQIVLGYFILAAFVRATVELIRLFRVYRQVKRGYAPVNRKDWQQKADRYRAAFRAYPILLVIFGLLVIGGRSAYRSNSDYRDLPPVGTELPFLTVADMAQNADVQSAQRMENVNYMTQWPHILSSVNYQWAEIVEVVDTDGTEGKVSIQLTYHETRFAWLAESLTREYTAEAKQTGEEMVRKPEIHADEAWFYYNQYGAPSVVLRHGNTVIRAEFPRLDIDDPALTFDYWLEAMDHALTQK